MVLRESAVLSSATLHAMPPEFGRKQSVLTICYTAAYVEYNVKLKKHIINKTKNMLLNKDNVIQLKYVKILTMVENSNS